MEYSRTGAVIKGQEKAVIKSRYEEDVLFNNHTVSKVQIYFSILLTFYRGCKRRIPKTKRLFWRSSMIRI